MFDFLKYFKKIEKKGLQFSDGYGIITRPSDETETK